MFYECVVRPDGDQPPESDQRGLFEVISRVGTDVLRLTHILSPDPSRTKGMPQKGRQLESGTTALKETACWSPWKLSLHPTTALVWKELEPVNGAARKNPGEHLHFPRNQGSDLSDSKLPW